MKARTKGSMQQKILLNYIYLAKEHAGGKDQFALNLLSGIYENGDAEKVMVVCYDYLKDVIQKAAPTVEVVTIASKKMHTELERMYGIFCANTIEIPKIIRQHQCSMIFHASCNNGLHKFSIPSVSIPHDIKAISHRVLGAVKIPWYKYILYKIMYTMDFKHADKVVAISQNDQKEMQQYFHKYADKIVQIYNPIKVKKRKQCTVTDELIWKDGAYSGNIVAINLQFHHKNIITLLQAYEQVREEIQCNLILIGALPERVHYLKTYVEEHGLEDSVLFTGFIEGKEKRDILLKSDLYVNPSLFEGFGMTAVEAMLLQVPTLLANVSANHEVTAGLCRYYEPADSVEALTQALREYFHNPCSKEQLEQAGSIMAMRYDYHLIARQYIELFQECIQ